MSSTSETETEILLGNRHLLAIFFVLAVLLGIAFTGGYMVGRNSPDKKPAALSASADPAASSTGNATGSAETHSIPAAGSEQTATVADPAPAPPPAVDETPTTQAPPVTATAKDERPLGAPKQKPLKPSAPFAGPQSGQTFLQVAAVGRTDATALADVLSKKGFRAHAVPKPGASDIYRVLIGPMDDATELSATRDSLRNAGFTKIFVQKY